MPAPAALPPAPAAVGPAPAVHNKHVMRQADGHGAVRFRKALGEKTMCLIPDGSDVTVLSKEGEWAKIVWQGLSGYVKQRNVAMTAVAAAEASTVCKVTVNGKQYSIDALKDSVTGFTSAHDWMAANVPGTGLRRNCGVGRCGVCVSTLSYTDPATGKMMHRAFNTCLRPILSCNGMAITTITGLGDTKTPHPVQKALADNSGTQCGFCSAGQVMSIYSHLAGAGSSAKAADLEHCLDGNLCRCTGYRSIIDTAKSFASDAPPPTAAPICGHAATVQREPARLMGPSVPFVPAPLPTGSTPVAVGSWQEVRTEAELQAALRSLGTSGDVMLVAGNTSKGLWEKRRPTAQVCIGGIPTLRAKTVTADGLILGSAVTMTDAQEAIQEQAQSTKALEAIAKHVLLSPGTPVRNVGTIGGNVMLMHEHQKDGQSFATEWPMLFQAWGATVTVVDSSGHATELSFESFWGVDMKGKYIRHFTLPLAGASTKVMRSFRTSVRHLYAQQFCGGAMCVNLDRASGRVAAGSARVVLNNIVAHPLRATALEKALEAGSVTDQGHFQTVLLPALESVLSACDSSLYGEVQYRKQLARSYFYKFMLALQPTLAPHLQSAAESWLDRPTQSGTQTFHTDPSVYPLNEPIPKIDGLKQTCAEAQYVQDVPLPAGALHGAPVIATAIGDLDVVDPKAAESMPGYQGFLWHKDVPLLCPGVLAGAGKKQFFQPLFAKGKTEFIGQVIGLVLADTQQGAVDAANAVRVTYKNVKSNPIITLDDAIKAESYLSKSAGNVNQGDADKALASADFVVQDTFRINEQAHYHMETQSCMAVPGEDQMVLHASTQEPKIMHLALQLLLLEGSSKVDVRQRRLGGGFGGKLEASLQVGCLSGFAAHKMKRPVRVILELGTNLVAIGHRPAFRSDIQVGCMKDGTITAVKAQTYFGNSGGDVGNFLGSCDNCYNIPNWNVQASTMKLDLPITRSCRGPGWVPGIWFGERIAGLVAAKLGMPSVAVKEKNFYQKGQVTPGGFPLKNWNMQELWATLKASSEYEKRAEAVAAFNASNRWVKKGLAMAPSKFTFAYLPSLNIASALMMDCRVTIHADGSVAVLSGGTEMGQGLTTKVSQTVSYHLGCKMSDITFLEQQTSQMGSIATGLDLSGGSVASELTCLSAKNCCNALNQTLAPVYKQLGPSATWQQVCAKAAEMGLDLSEKKNATGHAPGVDKKGDVYSTYGAACAEVSVDILTGQINLGRTDLIFDIGRSVNPDVDIGQVEGGFTMGLGLALLEDVSYDAAGAMTAGAATYEPPGTVDIPQEWHVTLFNGAVNPVTPGGAKAIGEPPVSLSYVAVDAIQQAFAAAAKDAGSAEAPRADVLPFTVDRRGLTAPVDAKLFTLS
eukprot:TRINITY_DN765_c0_g1_i1.p1 TRINITY_DN765_c0_g1~~TRINITY_DN765_c0_g1_i1.p1  ORF type:complete len:1433 (+),score=487.88 TRINITY_DN765_c0_g1_i1:161-4300(+)